MATILDTSKRSSDYWTGEYNTKLSENNNFTNVNTSESPSIGNNMPVTNPISNVPTKKKSITESARKAQSEVYSKLDSAICVLNKLPTIDYYLGEFVDGDISALLQSPMYVLLQILNRVGVTDEKIINWLCDMLVVALPSIEIGVKGVLLAKLKETISCVADPRIPKKLRKKTNKYFEDYIYDIIENNPAYSRGILVNVNSIDPEGILHTSPWGDGKDNYFGAYYANGLKKSTHKLSRADDFNAFLWYLIHKGRFPSPTGIEIQTEGDDAPFFYYPNTNFKYKVNGNTLLSSIVANPVYNEDYNEDRITEGQVFTSRGAGNVISMCYSKTYDNGITKQPTSELIMPISSDWTSLNWYADKSKYFNRNLGLPDDKNDYNKEDGICNVEYIRPYADSSNGNRYTEEMLRVTVLPKPFVYAPYGGLTGKIKKILFNKFGVQDKKGRFSLPTDATTSSGTPYVRRVQVTMMEQSTKDYIDEHPEVIIKYLDITAFLNRTDADEEEYKSFTDDDILKALKNAYLTTEEEQSTAYLNALIAYARNDDVNDIMNDSDIRLCALLTRWLSEKEEEEASTASESEIYAKYMVGEDDDHCMLYVNKKTGEYNLGGDTEETKNILPNNFSKHFVECYNGLTVYEFNYDYIMSQRLFEPGVVAKRLLNAVRVEIYPGLSLEVHNDHNKYSYNNQSQRIQNIVRQIIMEEDEEIYSCFYRFSNDDYDRMLRDSENARYFGTDYNYNEYNGNTNIDSLLDSLYDDSATLDMQKTVIHNAIEASMANVIDQSSVALQDRRQIRIKFVLSLVTNLTSILMESLITPKMLLILYVNQRLLGGKKVNDTLRGREELTINNLTDSISDITVENLLNAMKGVVVAIAREIVEMIIRKLTELILDYIRQIVLELSKKIVMEQLQAFMDVYRLLLQLYSSFNCAKNLFGAYAPIVGSIFKKLRKLIKNTNTDLPTVLDNVNYADIFDTDLYGDEDKPLNTNC